MTPEVPNAPGLPGTMRRKHSVETDANVSFDIYEVSFAWADIRSRRAELATRLADGCRVAAAEKAYLRALYGEEKS